jgi:predicted dinucleotide-utilizing enzyme
VERITNARLYGNAYPLAEYMADLTDAIFAADARDNVNTFRQNLQLAYTTALAGVLSEEGKKQYDFVAQSAALQSLQQIENMIGSKRGTNAETQAHTAHVLHLIETAMSAD